MRIAQAFWGHPAALLLATGLFLGANMPLGKLAAAAGIGAPLWAFIISAGTGGLLTGFLALRGRGLPWDRRALRYYGVVAVISYAAPNLMLLSALPHIGAGFAGVMYALTPPLTLGFAALTRSQRPGPWGVLGIVLGCVGAALVATTRGELGKPAEPLWLALALIAPVSLAAGNVYRSLDWPPGAGSTELAAGSHLTAALLLGGVALGFGEATSAAAILAAPGLTALQIAVAAVMFATFFRLQAVGGAVYLSQIGYVAAAVGLALGVLFLGERYAPLTWLGAGLAGLGVALTSLKR